MKMQWRRGAPEKDGVYLVWNPAEENEPTVMHYQKNHYYGLWTYRINKHVMRESVEGIFERFASQFIDEVARRVKLTAKQRDELLDMPDEFDSTDDAYGLVREMFDELHFEHAECVYDVGPPEYWSELPYLWAYEDEDAETATMESGNPNDFDAEIADVRAAVVSRVAEVTERAIAHELQRMQSPWEAQQAPWSKPND